MNQLYKSESDIIKETLLSLVPKLKTSGKIFMLFRLYRIYGENNYLETLKKHLIKTTIPNLEYYVNNNFSKSIIEKELSKLYPLSEPVPKKLKRNIYINNNTWMQDLILFKKIVTDFEYLNRVDLIKNLNPKIYTSTQEYIKSNYPKIIYFIESNQESILFTPVQIVNSLYLTKFLPESPYDQSDEVLLFKIIQGQYTDEIIKDKITFLNYLYTLTHIIIGESQFYDKKIYDDKFDWIWDKFKYLEKEIFLTEEVDIIAEIGVCWSLSRNSKPETIDKYKDVVSKYFSTKYRYIPSKFYKNGAFEDLNFCKHRNILALMLFSGIKNL